MSYENNPGKTIGNLFVNDYKKNDKHPAFNGFVEIDRDQIEHLISMGKSGETPKLSLAAWVYPDKKNQRDCPTCHRPERIRYFLSVEVPKQKPESSNDDWGRPQQASKQDDWGKPKQAAKQDDPFDDDIPF